MSAKLLNILTTIILDSGVHFSSESSYWEGSLWNLSNHGIRGRHWLQVTGAPSLMPRLQMVFPKLLFFSKHKSWNVFWGVVVAWVQCWRSPCSGATALGGGSVWPGKRWAACALHSNRMESSNIATRVRPLARPAVRGPNGEADLSNYRQSQTAVAIWMPPPWCLPQPFHMYITPFLLLSDGLLGSVQGHGLCSQIAANLIGLG